MEHKTYPVMDKYKPSYDLRKIQKTGYFITRTALMSAAELGFDADGIHEVIASMEQSHFYKSMTSKYNHKVWQDVYHVPFGEYLGSTDKFSRAILAHLFCPLFVSKSST